MVYVLSQNGQPLMPTENHVKVRVLLKQGKAKVVQKCPFTIQLLYESTTHTQEINLGYKAGILDNSIIEMKASFFKPNIWLNMCIEYIILCV